MAPSRNPGSPRAGDVVVAPRPGTEPTYDLRVYRSTTQLTFYTREDALRDAETFAEIHGVDVWYTADGHQYQSIVRRRQGRRTPAQRTAAR